ncbi:MAG: tandem-95 repeat protein [Thermoplasmata archaeon]
MRCDGKAWVVGIVLLLVTNGAGSAGSPATAPVRGNLGLLLGEPNNDFGNATEIPGEGGVFLDTLDTTDSADIYKLMLNRTENSIELVRARLNKTEEAGQIRVYVYDSLGYRLAWNATVGTNAIWVEAAAPFTGYVFLSVLIGPGSPALEYTLDVKKENRTIQPGELDENNSPGKAIRALQGYRNTSGLDSLLDAADYYAVRLDVLQESRDVLTVSLATPDTGDYMLELFRLGESSHIAYSDAGDIFNPDYGADETIHFIPAESGDYIVRVWAERGSGDYLIVFRLYRAIADTDNDIKNATDVGKNLSLSGGVAQGYDDSDYYKIYLRPETTLSVLLTSMDYDSDFGLPNLNLWLFEPEGTVVNSSTSFDPKERVGHLSTVAGWYYIKVGAGRNSAGNYTLELSTIQPPEVLNPTPEVILDEDTSAQLDLHTIFRDPFSRPLSFGFEPPQFLCISLEGSVLNIEPLPNWNGRQSFTVSATNIEEKTARAEVGVTVRPINDPPVALHPELRFSSPEDEPFELQMSAHTLFTDVDGDELSFASEGAKNLTVSFLDEARVRVVPMEDWWGMENFTIVAEDPSGAQARVRVTMTITPVNDAPRVAQTPEDISFPEDTSTSLEIGRFFYDPDGDTLNYSSAGGMALWVVIHDGVAAIRSFYPDWFGTEEITFFARDPSGTSASFSLNITATPVEDPPQVWRRLPDQSIKEDQPTTLFNLNSYFRDPDGDNLSFSAAGQVRIQVNISAEGWVTFTPEANWSGTEALRFLAEDSTGLRAYIDFNLTVEPVNDPPVLAEPSVSPSKGDIRTRFTFKVLCSDIDSEAVSVSLVIGRRSIPMERASGSLASGAVFQVSTTLREGENTYYFLASDGIAGTATKSYELKVGPGSADNTLLYLSLGILIVIVVALALAFSPPRWSWTEEEE